MNNHKMSAGQLLKQANQLKRLGKLDEAIALYHQVIDINPYFAWAYHGLGDALAKQGNLDEAVTCYSEGLKINTHSAWLFYSLGEALAELGDLEAAVEYLQKAIELKPDCYKFYNSLGPVFTQQKKFDEALSYYKQAIKLNSKVVYGYLGCCCTYLYLGDLLKAEESLKLALRLHPKNQKVKLYANFFRIILELDKRINCDFKIDIKSLTNNVNQHQKRVAICSENKDFKKILNIVKVYEDLSENKDLMIPELSEFHFIISQITLEGIDYIAILKRLHNFLNPFTYVEIGIETGRSFDLAHSSTLSIGIDPKPRLTNPIRPNSKIFCQTSDEFFQSFNLLKELKSYKVDLAFVDGLHLFEQTLKDFINLERYSHPNTIICFHDTLPLDEITSRRERATRFWSGDVWKIVPILKRYRPDLEIFTVATQPTGLTIVTNLDCNSHTLSDNYHKIVDKYIHRSWIHDFDLRCATLSVINNSWRNIQTRIKATQQDSSAQ